MKQILAGIAAVLLFAACQPKPVDSEVSSQAPEMPLTCADALLEYVEKYPAAESQDLYKLVFQDLYGPGHLLTDSAACAHYISEELSEMTDSKLPLFEYTLCEGNFVRVNLSLVADSTIPLDVLTSAVMRSAKGIAQPDRRFVISHSQSFKNAYHPHYRIVRRDIFENEILPLISKQ